ncbi:importin subunit alpha isoform X2 [Bradysia coprophila]|uniref:importin subunit alpha isoform X2 n=1 Tax=Bradysia coprophila TaxID=38358 RepID=UPI00187D86BC|nr:importin subunit alpha isoform X2 [Bradysia coprophila]
MSNENRIDAYKNHGKNSDRLRSSRKEATIELRKARKEDQILKRRNINIDPEFALQDSNGQSPCTKTPEEILFGMDSASVEHIFDAVQSTRKMLSRERQPPIDLMIRHGIVPKLVTFLDYSDDTNLQFEAAWALTNIASGTSAQTMAVVDAGAVDKFIRLLSSPSPNVAEQAVWALGNIAGDGSKTRDIVLNANVVEGLIQLFATDLSITSLRNITWLMSNLFRNKNPSAPFDKVKVMLPHLARLLLHQDSQVVTDAAWAISYVTDDDNNKIQAVIDHGCVHPLVRLLERDDASIIVPSLRSIGNIVTGNDQQTDSVISAGALVPLKKLLQSNKTNIVKEAAWTISNITAGNSDQIEHVINSDVFPIIRTILEKGDFKSQKEAAWIVTNTTTSGTPEQVIRLVTQYNVFIPFCLLMDSKDTRTVNVVLAGLTNILELADKFGGTEQVLRVLEENNCIDILEKLQSHENEDIYKRSLFIIEKYFNDEEQENNLGPGYQF